MSRTWRKALALAKGAENRLSNYRGDLTAMASDFFEGEVTCEYIPGDGFVMCWEDVKSTSSPHVMPVGIFFFLAEKYGEVTENDFKTHSI